MVKIQVNVKERVEDNVCDLALSGLGVVPVKEIASFKRVNILDLSSNQIVSLGKNFTTLTRLVRLDLSKNQIKYLPEDFGLLHNLRHLVLYDNKIEYLPLSFGNLKALRYLDLKGNPLMPALAKVVGLCLTTRECQDSAHQTVKFLSLMQNEAKRARQEYQTEIERIGNDKLSEIEETQTESTVAEKVAIDTAATTKDNRKTNKKSNKKTKSKSKKANNDIIATKESAVVTTERVLPAKTAKIKKSANNTQKKRHNLISSTALSTIFVFILLLAINVLVIYMIMFKNPEIAEKLVELIPQQYRAWILAKTEIFRLHVSDWISEFRTPPEEH